MVIVEQQNKISVEMEVSKLNKIISQHLTHLVGESINAYVELNSNNIKVDIKNFLDLDIWTQHKLLSKYHYQDTESNFGHAMILSIFGRNVKYEINSLHNDSLIISDIAS